MPHNIRPWGNLVVSNIQIKTFKFYLIYYLIPTTQYLKTF